jgi:hypothetical protein
MDNEYKYYFTVVYFQDSNAITEEMFNTAVKEKNLLIIGLSSVVGR